MIPVVVVDDHPVVRAMMQITRETGDICAAVNEARNEQPDLAFMEEMLPGINEIEGVPYLKRLLPKCTSG